MKTALILEGGGCKGAFEAGIIKYISEKQIKIDLVGGTSVGGLNAACFAFNKCDDLISLWENIDNSQVYVPSGFVKLVQSLETSINPKKLSSIKDLVHQLLYCLHGPWWTHIPSWVSLVGIASKLFKQLQLPPSATETINAIVKNVLEKNCLLDNTPLQQVCERLFGTSNVADAPTPLYITAFELQGARLTYFGHDSDEGDLNVPLVDALMATSAIQLAFPTKLIGNKQYIDGGNGSNLPLKYAIRHQCDRIILARDNMVDKPVTDMFRKVWDVVLRAYLASFTNVTIQDEKWAGEISKRILREQENIKMLQQFTSQILEPQLKQSYENKLKSYRPIFDNKYPIEIIEVVPDWTPSNIVDFNADTSRKLIQNGYEKASNLLANI